MKIERNRGRKSDPHSKIDGTIFPFSFRFFFFFTFSFCELTGEQELLKNHSCPSWTVQLPSLFSFQLRLPSPSLLSSSFLSSLSFLLSVVFFFCLLRFTSIHDYPEGSCHLIALYFHSFAVPSLHFFQIIPFLVSRMLFYHE